MKRKQQQDKVRDLGCFEANSKQNNKGVNEPYIRWNKPNKMVDKIQAYIVIPIKVRWDDKRVNVFPDNRGQGSTFRSKDLNARANLL